MALEVANQQYDDRLIPDDSDKYASVGGGSSTVNSTTYSFKGYVKDSHNNGIFNAKIVAYYSSSFYWINYSTTTGFFSITGIPRSIITSVIVSCDGYITLNDNKQYSLSYINANYVLSSSELEEQIMFIKISINVTNKNDDKIIPDQIFVYYKEYGSSDYSDSPVIPSKGWCIISVTKNIECYVYVEYNDETKESEHRTILYTPNNIHDILIEEFNITLETESEGEGEIEPINNEKEYKINLTFDGENIIDKCKIADANNNILLYYQKNGNNYIETNTNEITVTIINNYYKNWCDSYFKTISITDSMNELLVEFVSNTRSFKILISPPDPNIDVNISSPGIINGDKITVGLKMYTFEASNTETGVRYYSINRQFTIYDIPGYDIQGSTIIELNFTEKQTASQGSGNTDGNGEYYKISYDWKPAKKSLNNNI